MAIATATSVSIARAARQLQAGELVAFPTETVYGLGADATNSEAVARIFAAKGRPHFNPLIIHVLDIEAARALGQFNATATRLAETFWPGPLTLVVKKMPDAGIADLATPGLETIALRSPAHPVARAVLAQAGRPIAAPSANRSGRVSPTLACHVEADLGREVSMILDGGSAVHGLESTVIDASREPARLLRPGAIAADAIEAVLGCPLARGDRDDAERPSSPGQLARHYAPHARLRLDAHEVLPGEVQLAFGPALMSDGMIINLSPSGDLVEAAAVLFASLRALDEAGAAAVAVMPIPHRGLGEAINDRLRRAATPED